MSVLAMLCLAAPALAAGISTAPSPQVVFATPGLKTVTLNICNANLQCSQVTKTVEVLDPAPVIVSAAVTTTVEVPAAVHLEGIGTGRPALTYVWHVQHLFDCAIAPEEVATLDGPTLDWSTSGFPAGSYQAVLDLTNGNGTTVSSIALPITVTPDPTKLLDDGFEAPCSTTPWTFSESPPS